MELLGQTMKANVEETDRKDDILRKKNKHTAMWIGKQAKKQKIVLKQDYFSE